MSAPTPVKSQPPADDFAPPAEAPSPRWPISTKRLAATVMLVLALLGLYRIRALLVPIIMAIVVAYVLLPVVDFIHRRTRISRTAAIAMIYLLIVAALVAIPITTIPQLIAQANDLIVNAPTYLEQLGDFLSRPIVLGGFTIPLDSLPLERVYQEISENLIEIVRTIGQQGFSIFGNLASRTLSTVGWIIIILILSVYIVKDYRELWGSMVRFLPVAYHADMGRLGREISLTWNAFLRGQLILGLIVGSIVFVVAVIIGLPNALLLGLLAGLLEFVPNIGPAIAAIPAVLLALFQSESSWLGTQVGPLWYAVIVLILYAVIQQVENAVLVPRIIGRSLNLHPLVVFIGALAGASVAGVVGILLAAPLLASAKLIFNYIYRKLMDQPPFPAAEGAVAARRGRPRV